jgi:hypothetical protein
MTEWIDFAIYATSNFVLWIMLPLAYRELAIPVMMDRNPEWVAANPDAVQRIARSYWFNNSCIAWGVLAVTALLLVRLGVQVPGTNPSIPLWQRLSNMNNLLFIVGFVCFGALMFFVQRRLKQWIPQGVRRSASLQPRSTGDSVPLYWRIATEVVTVVLFTTWIITGVMGIARSPKLWDGLVFLFVNTVIFAVMAYASAKRPQNYMDRIYGPAYRHREVRIIYGARWAFVAFGAVMLTGSIVGPDAMPVNVVRLSFLLFQIIFVTCLLAFVLMKPAHNPSAPVLSCTVKSSGLTTSLVMLIVVPLIAVASTSATMPARCCAASTPSFRALPAAVSADRPSAGHWLR